MVEALQLPVASNPVNTLDELFTITCGHCQKASACELWFVTPVGGELPHGEYQCPACGRAFRREHRPFARSWEKSVVCVEIPRRL